MNIIILGSGLLGVSTAYELGRRGYDVTVIDRQPESGCETSFANGGQLSYSHAEPWANPAALPKIIPWMFRSDAPLVLRPRLDWEMMKWGVKFLRNCTHARANVNCANILRLGMYSKTQFEKVRADTGIAFDYSDKGILHIYGSEEEFDYAKAHNDFQAKFGCEQRVLTREEALSIEPALADTPRAIVGGIHAFNDESGDAYLYCKNLADYASKKYNVKFQYGVTIKDFRTNEDSIEAIITDQGDITGDAYVMAMGSYSPVYLRKLGISVPVYPMKGYSITAEANEHCPNISLTDGTHKIVYSRLGNRMRVAGTAEFAGYNTAIREKRVTPIIDAVKGLFPKALAGQEIKKWACLRPSTPDGPPIMGRSSVANLFLNTGHGTLGWTQAAGSATLLSDIMEGNPPEILLQGLTLERYL